MVKIKASKLIAKPVRADLSDRIDVFDSLRVQARYVREARALYAHGTHLCELCDNDCASA